MSKKSVLNARIGFYLYTPNGIVDYDNETVGVYFGDALVTTLTPIRKSKAGHGDDSKYFESEERDIIDETVATWLRERLGL